MPHRSDRKDIWWLCACGWYGGWHAQAHSCCCFLWSLCPDEVFAVVLPRPTYSVSLWQVNKETELAWRESRMCVHLPLPALLIPCGMVSFPLLRGRGLGSCQGSLPVFQPLPAISMAAMPLHCEDACPGSLLVPLMNTGGEEGRDSLSWLHWPPTLVRKEGSEWENGSCILPSLCSPYPP